MFSSTTCLLACSVLANVFTVSSGLNILLLGGNGLIGGHTARRLFEAGHRLTAINRGSQNWDWPTQLAGHFQHTLKCNRVDPLKECEDFQKFAKTKPLFDLVIDFSGFEVHWIDNTIPALIGTFERYLFISTDSVYEVSKPRSHNKAWREEDAVRPDEQQQRTALAEKDQYAEYKMRCEEQLEGYAKKFNFSVVMLRLPDVIGQRDSTLRFWAYMVVVELAALTKQTLLMPTFSSHWQMSMVYVDDVARFLVLLTNKGSASDAIWPQIGTSKAMNFANPQTMTLGELISRIIELQRLKVKVTTLKDHLATRPKHLYPSVTGGSMDVSLLTKSVHFSFTPWDTALRASVKFYRQQTDSLQEGKGFEHLQKLYSLVTHVGMLPHFDDFIWKRFLGHKHVEL